MHHRTKDTNTRKCLPLVNAGNIIVTSRRSCRTDQWSFRKTGTIGTLASQAEIGVWIQAPGALGRGRPLRASSCGGPGYHPGKCLRFYSYAVHFWPENGCNAAHYAFINTLTMGTEFPRVLSRNDLWYRRSLSHRCQSPGVCSRS